MSDIPRNHRVFNYTFNNGFANYWFEFIDGNFGYWYEEPSAPLRWHFWNISLENLEETYSETEYRRAKPRAPSTFIGPIQPPPSPLIQKIREMEKRRQVAYA